MQFRDNLVMRIGRNYYYLFIYFIVTFKKIFSIIFYLFFFFLEFKLLSLNLQI